MIVILDKGPVAETQLTHDEAVDYYNKMQTIRRLETSASNLYKEKKIRGFCHLYSGQEACAVGIVAAKDEEDAVITAYRWYFLLIDFCVMLQTVMAWVGFSHGWTYLMGAPPKEVIAELTGRISGNVHGKGGSMHMYAKNFYGGNGIVGAQQPIVSLYFQRSRLARESHFRAPVLHLL
jgi:pyruvate dehydrogenase E1 component alpha subunit